jgi:hypothetical protein
VAHGGAVHHCTTERAPVSFPVKGLALLIFQDRAGLITCVARVARVARGSGAPVHHEREPPLTCNAAVSGWRSWRMTIVARHSGGVRSTDSMVIFPVNNLRLFIFQARAGFDKVWRMWRVWRMRSGAQVHHGTRTALDM